MNISGERLIAVLLASGVLLGGCSGEQKAYEASTVVEGLNKAAVFSEELSEIALETGIELYGIEGSKVSSGVVYGSLRAGAEELAVFVLTDEGSAEEVAGKLEERIEEQKEALKEYQPEEVVKLEGGIVSQRGSSVVMVVASDGAGAQKVLDGL